MPKSKQKPATIGVAHYVVADAKNRIIEEIGFKDATKDNKRWVDEAYRVFVSIELIKEKTSDIKTTPFTVKPLQ